MVYNKEHEESLRAKRATLSFVLFVLFVLFVVKPICYFPRRHSYSAIAAALETLRLSILAPIGIAAVSSQR
jgi:hypothetical protein